MPFIYESLFISNHLTEQKMKIFLLKYCMRNQSQKMILNTLFWLCVNFCASVVESLKGSPYSASRLRTVNAHSTQQTYLKYSSRTLKRMLQYSKRILFLHWLIMFMAVTQFLFHVTCVTDVKVFCLCLVCCFQFLI